MRLSKWSVKAGVFLLAAGLMFGIQTAPAGAAVSTQMGLILDGSGSISDADFQTMLKGLSGAVKNCMPHDGSVELTVMQFGLKDDVNQAVVEIGPVVVTDANADSLSASIELIEKMGGQTPIGCALHLAADTLRNSPNYSKDIKQAVNLATDGRPNVVCGNAYTGSYEGYGSEADTDSINARNYLVSHLQMTTDQDEFDVEYFGPEGTYSDWLRTKLVYPQVGTYAPPYTPGWVKVISDYADFETTVCTKFQQIFKDPIILIDKDVLTDPPTVLAGGVVEYQIKVENSANTTALNAEIWDDRLPTGFTYVLASDTVTLEGGATQPNVANDFSDLSRPRWRYFNIPVGGSVTIQFSVQIAADVPAGTYDNTADAVGDNFPQISDDGLVAQDTDTPPGEDPENDEDVTIEAPAQPLLQIDKDTLTPTVVAGGAATYVITLTNVGEITAVGAEIWDQMQEGFTFSVNDLITAENGATPVDSGGLSILPSSGDAEPHWGVWTIPPGGKVTIQFEVFVPLDIPPGRYDNTAWARGENFDPINDDGTVGQDPDTPVGDDPTDDEDVVIEQGEPPSVVPTMGQWGFLVLVAGFGLTGLRAVRRRRRK